MTASPKKCIALIGLRGCGKTTVGRELARLVEGECVDTDEVIVERAGRSIADIFATEGESGFRERESDVIRAVVRAPPVVISVGGGAVLDLWNVEALRGVATVVWLTAPAEVLWQRISQDTATGAFRPPLTDRRGVEEIRRLLGQRTSLYARAADLQIETVDREPREIAEEIVRRTQPPLRSGAGD